MNSTRSSHRDTLITILLVLAGVLLALTLFGAGALWKGKASPRGTVDVISSGGASSQ